jgi:hypothetical protein
VVVSKLTNPISIVDKNMMNRNALLIYPRTKPV